MRSISVIINARLGSTRLSQKLIRPFAGSTLIDIALEKINRMDFFQHRYLAAAEEEFKQRVPRHPQIQLLVRSPDAVKPGFNDPKVVNAHYLDVESDFIFWLNPCHPLLSIETVKKAFDVFQRTEHSSYTAVLPTKEWLFDSEGNPLTNKDPKMISTNHSNSFFKVAHSFHIFSREFFRKTGLNWGMTRNDPHLIPVPIEEVFDCDTPLEFRIAELMYLDRLSPDAIKKTQN